MSTKFLCLATITLTLLALSNSDDSQDVQECASSLVGLSTCLPYVGGTAKSPTPDCCTGLKQVLKTSKKCLCVVIKDRNDPNLGLNINVTLALGLPVACNAPANISECPALLKLPPNSPEAQVFYQLKTNSTSISPAGAPSTNAPTSSRASSAGATATGSRTGQSNGSCFERKRTLVVDIFILVLVALALFQI